MKTILGISSFVKKQDISTHEILQIEKEILYAHKFNSTIIDSSWFKYKNVSPGGSAVDYCFFYTLYRVLSSIKPKSILEFGLGQSSKMVHQFANFHKSLAVTVEHDSEWAKFFVEGKDGDYSINIKFLELETKKYKGVDVLTYKDCYDTFKNSTFDLIIVDGPFGFSENTIYSRPQIIELINGCISKDFVIIIDDYERTGEQNTVKEIFELFNTNHIDFVYTVYSTVKSHILITVPKFHFLTTL